MVANAQGERCAGEITRGDSSIFTSRVRRLESMGGYAERISNRDGAVLMICLRIWGSSQCRKQSHCDHLPRRRDFKYE